MAELYEQTQIAGLQKNKEKGFCSLEDLFKAETVSDEAKVEIVQQIYEMETHNSYTKQDLVAVIRWMADYCFEWVPIEQKHSAKLKVIK